MPPQNALPTASPGLLPQPDFLAAVGARDNAARQTRRLGLFRKQPIHSISLISRMLPLESSSPKGPKRPSFSHCAFLENPPAHRAGLRLIPSPLRSPRFLLPPGSARGTCVYGERLVEVTPQRRRRRSPEGVSPSRHGGTRCQRYTRLQGNGEGLTICGAGL